MLHLIERITRLFEPYDDRISEGEYALFKDMPRRQRRELLRNRRKRIVDVWINPGGWKPGDWTPDPSLMGGGNQSFVEPVEVTQADGTQVSNTVTETIVTPDLTIPANYLYPGRCWRTWAFGVNSNVVTTPGTLTFRARWGGAAGTVLLASGAQGLDTTAHTNALWSWMSYHVCRSVGASGTIMSGGTVNVYNVLASTAANLLPALLGSAGAPGASGNVAVTVDTTAAKAYSLTSTSSVATSPTNVTCQQRVIEMLN